MFRLYALYNTGVFTPVFSVPPNTRILGITNEDIKQLHSKTQTELEDIFKELAENSSIDTDVVGIINIGTLQDDNTYYVQPYTADMSVNFGESVTMYKTQLLIQSELQDIVPVYSNWAYAQLDKLNLESLPIEQLYKCIQTIKYLQIFNPENETYRKVKEHYNI